MKQEQITVKGKVGSIEIQGKYDYEYPESLEEGIDMDTDKKVMQLYQNERKTQYMDKCRKDLIKRATEKIAEQMKTMDLDL
jgi:hypothetical protein